MRLILTRHGETIENIQNMIQGQSEGTLSEEGKKQIQKLAQRLKNEKIDFVYSSDLIRAKETAKAIIQFHPKISIIFDTRLRERNFGKYEKTMQSSELDWNNLPKDIESNDELYKRAKLFFDEIYDKHKDDTVLLVMHGGILRFYLTLLHNKPASEFIQFTKVNNTSLSIFDIKEDGNHNIILLNCDEHLR